jgi:hypothetical protein
VTQPAPRDAAGTPFGVITVADLLERCGPVLPAPGPRTGDVPVAALLHREGRPATTGRDAQAGATEDDGPEDAPASRRGPSASVVKRSAVAAGVLLVAGSVVGAAVATTDAPAAGPAVLDRGTPEQAQLHPVPALPGPAPTVATGPLDPGAAPHEPWLEVAFPGSTGSTGPTGTGPAGGDGSPVAGDDAPTDGTEERDGGPPPAGGDDGADDAGDDPGEEQPRDDGGNRGNGNGNGWGRDKDGKGSGDEAPEGGDESPGLVGGLLGVVPDLL